MGSKPPFDRNDKAAIRAALQNPNGSSEPIAVALAEAIERFTAGLARQAASTERFPDAFLLHTPETYFDEVVINMTLKLVSERLARPVTVHWVERRATNTSDA